LETFKVAEAVAVDTNEESFSEEDRLRDPLAVLELCTSLITLPGVGSDAEAAFKMERGLTSWDSHKREIKIVQFSHFTVKEYLLSDTSREKLPADICLTTSTSHVHISKICLVYLLDFNGGKRAQFFKHDEYPMLAYSAVHWKYHVCVYELFSTRGSMGKWTFLISHSLT
jgi:hypothetical protein